MLKIKVAAGAHERISCPVSFPIELEHKGPVKLKSRSGDLSGEVKSINDKGFLVFIIKHMPAGSEETYEVERTAENSGKISFKEVGNEKLEIYRSGELFTNYWCGGKDSKPYIYPLPFSGIKSVTRNFPMAKVAGESTDHKHHRSVWTGWGSLNGEDLWSEEEGHGFIIHKYFTLFSEGFCSANFRVLNHWCGRSNDKLLEENRSVTFYSTGEETCLLDYEVALFASEKDVEFGDTKEGGMLCVRMATPLEGDKGGMIINSEGAYGQAECWGKRASWCDYSGTIDGKKTGICLYDSPQNLKYPVYWHVRNYGLFGANPFGVSEFKGNRQFNGAYTLKKGNELVFRYRMLIHKGGAEDAKPAVHFHNFVNPPKVSVIL